MTIYTSISPFENSVLLLLIVEKHKKEQSKKVEKTNKPQYKKIISMKAKTRIKNLVVLI